MPKVDQEESRESLIAEHAALDHEIDTVQAAFHGTDPGGLTDLKIKRLRISDLIANRSVS